MTLEELLAAMEEASAKRFAAALDKLAAYEKDDAILKSELTELRTYGINRGFEAAWRALVQEPFLFAGDWKKLNEHERKISQITPAAHTVAGHLKRVAGAVKAHGAFRDRMIDVLEVLVPIAARAEALKFKIGKRAPKVTKTSIERAARDAKAMTCQICGRDILAEQGVIAHHGYTRPGMGWQTSSCEGARHVPFEVSRDVLADHLVAARDLLAHKKTFLTAVKEETVEIVWAFSDRSGCEKPWQRGEQRFRAVTRATFETVKAEIAPLRKIAKDLITFDDLKKQTISQITSEITEMTYYIDRQTKRHDGWQGPTHQFGDAGWVRLCTAPVMVDDQVDKWIAESGGSAKSPASEA